MTYSDLDDEIFQIHTIFASEWAIQRPQYVQSITQIEKRITLFILKWQNFCHLQMEIILLFQMANTIYVIEKTSSGMPANA